MSSSRRPRVLVTRSPHQASVLADSLRALGLEPILVPAIEVAEPTSYTQLDEAMAQLDRFDWLLFTSANAVEAFRHRLQASGEIGANAEAILRTRSGRGLRVGVIGASTARALAMLGTTADLIPERAVAESFADELVQFARQTDGRATRFLLVRAEEAREVIPDALRRAGAELAIAPAYRTVVAEGSVEAIRAMFHAAEGDTGARIDAITFTSSSSVRNLLALCEAAGVTLPSGVLLASIGPITSGTLRELGFEPDVEAAEASVTALAEAVARALGRNPAGPV